MTAVRDDLLSRLWYGIDPLKRFPLRSSDFQGWNSEHPLLSKAISDLKPKVVVDVGVWKGGSTIFMASLLKNANLDGVVISVDTFLGSDDHWLHPTLHQDLGFEHGYPTLYHQFMSNVIAKNVQDYVLPLPMDSSNSVNILKARGVSANVIHIDAGHSFNSVSADLNDWWPLLAPGGILVGDDYDKDAAIWPEVKQAFDAFLADKKELRVEIEFPKILIQKGK